MNTTSKLHPASPSPHQLQATRRRRHHLRRRGRVAGAIRPRAALSDLQVLPFGNRTAARCAGALGVSVAAVSADTKRRPASPPRRRRSTPAALRHGRGDHAPARPLRLRAALGAGDRPPLPRAGLFVVNPQAYCISSTSPTRHSYAPTSIASYAGSASSSRRPIRSGHGEITSSPTSAPASLTPTGRSSTSPLPRPRCAEIPEDKRAALTSLWRDKQLQYTWLRSLQGRYADFWQVTGEALDFTLDSLGIATPALRERLMDLYRPLSAF